MNKITLFSKGLLLIGLLNYSNANAQNNERKEVRTSVMIMNGDTIVNGKKFSKLPESEKVELRKSFNGLNSGQLRISNNASKVIIVKSDVVDSVIADGTNQRVFNFKDGNQRMQIQVKTDGESNDMGGQNVERKVIIRKNGMDDRAFNMGRPENGMGAPIILQHLAEGGNMDFVRSDKPNSSRFNYAITDKNGYTTRTQISILEPNKADLKGVFNNENLAINSLAVDDLVLSPNYSSGKITLSFTSTAKGVLAVKLVDTDGKILFSENKAIFDNSYTKQFALAKNGIYYLEVSQAGKTYLRKLIKN